MTSTDLKNRPPFAIPALMYRLILLVVIGTVPQAFSGALAQAECRTGLGSADSPQTNVYFSNGINTDSFSASLSAIEMCEAYATLFESERDAVPGFDDEVYVFQVAFNDTQGFETDIVQVLQQKAEELGLTTEGEGLTGNQIYELVKGDLSDAFIAFLVEQSTLEDGSSTLFDFGLNVLIPIDLEPAIKRGLAEALETQIPAAMADQRVVETLHRELYLSDLASDRRVIVVAHSQGNLFSNKTVGEIEDEFPEFAESIEVLGVASPSAINSIRGFYVTAFDDDVINLLRDLVFDVANGTTSNFPLFDTDFRDEYRHNFSQSYFAQGLPSRVLIDEEMLRLIRDLRYPSEAPEPSVCTLANFRSTVTFGASSEIATFDGVGFDATRVADGAWVNDGTRDFVYYAGVPFGNNQDLGLAVSSDQGATWSKATSDPLIPRNTAPSWTSFRIAPLRVLYESNVFRLWFSGNNSNLFSDASNVHGFGYASTTDGLNWTVEPNPIRVESGRDQGARLLELVKQGDVYRAYYDDLRGSAPSVTFVAESTDGVTFSEPDQQVPFGDTHRLLAASARPGESCSYGIWRNRATSAYVATTSSNGVDFQIVSDVTFPSNMVPNDIRFDGNDIIVYGTRNDGNVNWNFTNLSLVQSRAIAFNN